MTGETSDRAPYFNIGSIGSFLGSLIYCRHFHALHFHILSHYERRGLLKKFHSLAST